MEDLVAYFDGDFMPQSEIRMPFDNLGFTRGYGAYECYRSWGLKPFHLDLHIKRLEDSCRNLMLDFPHVNFASITELLMTKNPGTDLIFRVYVTDHPEKQGSLLAILCNTPEYHFARMASPFKLKSILDRRPYYFKSTGYAAGIIEERKAKKEGFNGIVYVGSDNKVHELTRANIFAVKDGTLFTPKSFCLLGITRREILNVAGNYGYKSCEMDFDLDFLKDAEEVFASATIRALTPIAQIDDMVFQTDGHLEKLQEHFTSISTLRI